MRLGSLDVEFRCDRSAIVQGAEDLAVRLLLSLRPASTQPVHRLPSTLVLLLDCSGTMRRFDLTEEEAKHWVEVARDRSELLVAGADRQTVYRFKGQTLEDVRASATCPLQIAASALAKALANLRDNDVCCLVGFAAEARILHDGRRRAQASSVVDVLRSIERDPSAVSLGDSTRMQSGILLAAKLLRSDPSAQRLRRLVIITDGLIEDKPDSLRALEEIHREGIAISTVGVGPEFDEEFLSRIADWTSGSYHFAPDVEEVEHRLAEDLDALRTVAATQLTVSARGLSGAVVKSVSQLTPQMRMFEEIRLKDDWFQVDVGEISGPEGMILMGEFSLPWLPEGRQEVGEIELEWRDPETGETQKTGHVVRVDCLPPTASVPGVDSEVEEMFMRLEVYRAERAAQWAAEGGRPGLSTVRLREASRILHRLGENNLAERFERQASDVEDEQVDPGRTKTMKDWVRRLGRRQSDQQDK